MILLKPSSLRLSWDIILLFYLFAIITTTNSIPTTLLRQDLSIAALVADTTLPSPLVHVRRTRPLRHNQPPHLTIRTLYQTGPVERENPRVPAVLAKVLDRIYDSLATFILLHYNEDVDFIDAHDLTLRIGALRLDFHTEAELLSWEAMKLVMRRLGQLAQGGLTGLVTGEVRDVGAAVGVVFTLGIVGL